MERTTDEKRQRARSTRRGVAPTSGGLMLTGLGLVGLGTVLVLGRLDVVDAGDVIARWWPGMLVVAGAWWLWGGSRLGGGIAIGVGLVLLLTKTDRIPPLAGALVWPLVLVILGVTLMVVALRSRRALVGEGGPGRIATFASRQWIAGAADFAGSRSTALFGDVRLRLTEGHGSGPPDAGGVDGEGPVTISVMPIFGDVEIEVPAGWRIRDRVTCLFGAVRVPVEQPDWPEAPLLELHGVAVFGDLHVLHRNG